ncbi:MAG: hypothetical protein RXR82_08160 [Nitrososphaeria archaeon]
MRREGMGFKAMPWMLYWKPSLGEFVIRQRHTTHTSANVKAIKEQLKKTKGTDQAPARLAHYVGIQQGAARPVVKYVNGQRVVTLAVRMPYFRSALSTIMLNTIKPVAPEGKNQIEYEIGRAGQVTGQNRSLWAGAVRQPVSKVAPTGELTQALRREVVSLVE